MGVAARTAVRSTAPVAIVATWSADEMSRACVPFPAPGFPKRTMIIGYWLLVAGYWLILPPNQKARRKPSPFKQKLLGSYQQPAASSQQPIRTLRALPVCRGTA